MGGPDLDGPDMSGGNLVELVQLLLDLDAKQAADNQTLPSGTDHAMLVAP